MHSQLLDFAAHPRLSADKSYGLYLLVTAASKVRSGRRKLNARQKGGTDGEFSGVGGLLDRFHFVG